MARATEAALADAGMLHSALGQAALVLARRIDGGQESGGALAALVKAHRETLQGVLTPRQRPRTTRSTGCAVTCTYAAATPPSPPSRIFAMEVSSGGKNGDCGGLERPRDQN